MRSYLDFEKPVAELEAKVDELRALAASGSDIGDEIARIEDKASQALTDLYANLTPWQKTLVARHPQRPHFTDFVNALMTEFTPMAGDRKFAEDEALVDSLVKPGHPSTPGFTDPAYPLVGRVPLAG